MKRKSGRKSGRIANDHTEKSYDNGDLTTSDSDQEEDYEPEKKRKSRGKSVSFTAKNHDNDDVDPQYEVST